MAEKFQNRYRIPSARLQFWNYGSKAAYFITICTRGREHYFGEIINYEMQLSDLGKTAEQEWLKSTSIRPDMKLKLDSFVVMPNHFHGIIWIGEKSVETQCIASLQTPFVNKFGPQSKNLSSIIRGFKSAVTIYARKNNLNFGWQSRFHDHIIRDEESYQKIKNYIIANPRNWDEDRFNCRS